MAGKPESYKAGRLKSSKSKMAGMPGSYKAGRLEAVS